MNSIVKKISLFICLISIAPLMAMEKPSDLFTKDHEIKAYKIFATLITHNIKAQNELIKLYTSADTTQKQKESIKDCLTNITSDTKHTPMSRMWAYCGLTQFALTTLSISNQTPDSFCSLLKQPTQYMLEAYQKLVQQNPTEHSIKTLLGETTTKIVTYYHLIKKELSNSIFWDDLKHTPTIDLQIKLLERIKNSLN